ncbi:MAG: hypothetical protein AB7I48_13620 [Planctomycetaceae bacterium]
MKRTASLLALIAVAGLMMVTAPDQAAARPQYLKAFKEKYEKLAEEAKDCGVCHGGEKGKDKKQLSDYAMELKKALDAKNVKEAEKIDAAFDKAAEKKCGEDKTYGDLLKDGKLPPPYKEKDE